MLPRELILMFVIFDSDTKASSDFYKKLQDGASIIPMEIKKETDNQDREEGNNLDKGCHFHEKRNTL